MTLTSDDRRLTDTFVATKLSFDSFESSKFLDIPRMALGLRSLIMF